MPTMEISALAKKYRLALLKAEHAFVTDLVRRIVEDKWGPVDLWRDIQAAAARQHESQHDSQHDKSGEGAM